MKRMKWITNALAALMIVLAALGSLCTALVQKAHDPLFYGSQSRAAVMDAMGFASEEEVTAYIGLDWQQQDDLAGALANQMRLEYAEFHLEVLNDREQQHMRDVRDLVLLAQKVSQLCMTLAAGLAVAVAWTGARSKRTAMPIGVLAGVTIVAACAGLIVLMMNAQGFEALFIRFHELFFANDLWQLNPQTDILIRMMPQLLFERAAMDVTAKALQTFMIVWIMQCMVYGVVGGMIRRQLTERDKQ